ncbi:unnamed protein product [Dracunculus medinensis]|uniref:Cytochrome b-c1 complex subunit 8 n=1 Tax=Dracunculus medinensis TaxID=318479 RepID=A0A0N4UFP4_DRAME|nr:unnamed protein product [Dracunculus medinensis]
MRTTVVRLGKHFGGLGKMYGEYRFALAPNEQSAFKGFFHEAFVFNERIRYKWYFYVPPAIINYGVYYYAKKENKAFNSKNPADFENDE